MPVLNHHIVATRDNEATARFWVQILGFDPPTKLEHFISLRVTSDTTLDFFSEKEDFQTRHYAFLVTETEFDEILQRLQDWELTYWSDPRRSNADAINDWDDGRGLYFDDPNGHLLEIITRTYGSGGTQARHPHPLYAPTLEPGTATDAH